MTTWTNPLDEIDDALERRELRRAQAMLQSTRERPEVDPERLAQLEARLAGRIAVAGPAARFEAARAAGDWVEGRRHASEAARMAPDEAQRWQEAAALCAANLRAEWRIESLDLDVGLETVSSIAGLSLGVQVGSWTTSEGKLVLLNCLERWLFVYEVDTPRHRVERVSWLRVPESFGDLVDYQVFDAWVWLFGSGGLGLKLSLDPLDIVRSTSLRPFMLPGRDVSAAYISPDERYLWAEIDGGSSLLGVAVVDLETNRVCARPDAMHFHPTAGAIPTTFCLHPALDEGVRLFDAGGRSLPSLDVEPEDLIDVVAHPNGTGWVALVAIRDTHDPEDDAIGLVSLIDGYPPTTPQVIPFTHPDLLMTAAVSRSERLIFVLAASTDGTTRLHAYRPTLEGFVEAWQSEVPAAACLVQDHAANQCHLLFADLVGADITVPLSRGGPPPVPPPQVRLYWSFDFRGRQRYEEGDSRLLRELDDARRRNRVRAWTERHRKKSRKSPKELARLARLLNSAYLPDEARHVLDLADVRYSGSWELRIARAELQAAGKNWVQVEASLAELVDDDGADVDHDLGKQGWALLGSARLRLGDATGAHAAFARAGERAEDRGSDPDVARVLLALPPTEPASHLEADLAPGWQVVVRACQRADALRAEGDLAGARKALDVAAVFGRTELQSAARLADVCLAERSDEAPNAAAAVDASELLRLMAVARLAGIKSAFAENISGLAWDDERIEAVTKRSKAYLQSWRARRIAPVDPVDPVEPRIAETKGDSSPTPPEPEPHPRESESAPKTHSLPLLPHESLRVLVPGLRVALDEAVRLIRGRPEWSGTTSISEDLTNLHPVEILMRSTSEETRAQLEPQLDYCLNFELHRRKLFFVDESLAWMLHDTSLDIEAESLRTPFPCFGLVFTDDRTLQLAAQAYATLDSQGELVVPATLTAYIIEVPLSHARRGLRVKLVLGGRDGSWPRVIPKTLVLGDEAGLDQIIGKVDASEHRELLQLVINGILYCTSAGVPWPVANSPRANTRARGKGRGKAKAGNLQSGYSSENVYYLPGRIPIRQLPLASQDGGGRGADVQVRFHVRGHWRRPPKTWQDQRLRWIEPYWKGPEFAATIEKEYQLRL